MQRRKLGKRGPDVSVVGYGAWEIGGQFYGPNPGDADVLAAIRAGLDAGINWIDTAEIYGHGASERLVGRAIRGRRAEVLVATKVAPRPVGTGYEPDRVRKAVRGSLRRLGTDHLDLYQLHWFPEDPSCPIEETWAAMAALVDDGLIRHIGVSNFDRQAIERCRSVREVDSLQPHFSMLHRRREDLIRWCGEQGIGVIGYGPLAFGLLTGAITSSTQFHPSDFRSGTDPDAGYYREFFAPEALERHLATLEGLRPIAEGIGITLAQLALAWVIHQPGVTAAIAGSRNPEHNRANAAAGDVALPPDVLAAIEQALPPA